jgi:hypothetical protein
MNVIRMIKLFAWERQAAEKLNKTRDEELAWIRYNRILGVANTTVTKMLPLCHIVVTLGLYVRIHAYNKMLIFIPFLDVGDERRIFSLARVHFHKLVLHQQ